MLKVCLYLTEIQKTTRLPPSVDSRLRETCLTGNNPVPIPGCHATVKTIVSDGCLLPSSQSKNPRVNLSFPNSTFFHVDQHGISQLSTNKYRAVVQHPCRTNRYSKGRLLGSGLWGGLEHLKIETMLILTTCCFKLMRCAKKVSNLINHPVVCLFGTRVGGTRDKVVT